MTHARHVNTYLAVVVGLVTTLEVVPALSLAFSWHHSIAVVSVLISLFPLVFLAVLAAQVIIMKKQHSSRIDARLQREADAVEQLRKEDQLVQLTEQVAIITKQLECANEALDRANDELSIVQSQAGDVEQLNKQIEQLTREVEQKNTLIEQLSIVQSKPNIAQPVVQTDNTVEQSIVQRRDQILNILTEHISLGVSELHKMIGGDDVCSRGTLNNDLKALADDGKCHNADRKWHVGPEISAIQTLEFSTNGVSH